MTQMFIRKPQKAEAWVRFGSKTLHQDYVVDKLWHCNRFVSQYCIFQKNKCSRLGKLQQGMVG
jgi:hypothetical protein